MGYTGATVLFFCIALSMVAVGSAASDNSSYISLAALECSNNINPARLSRKLVDFPPPLEPGCPVRFDLMTKFGTIGTDCKGRDVSAAKCCGALQRFACPYRDLINDMSNGCTYEMFYMIVSTCGLELGIFSKLCSSGDQGLDCMKP